MKSSRQTTLRSNVTVTGVGVHSGKSVNLTLRPSSIDTGFVFLRTGLDGADRMITANRDAVTATAFATVLGDKDGPLVSTAEHVLAALRGMGVDNALIEVDGPEVPIMDGSAAPFVDAIDRAGVVQQAATRRFIEILKSVHIKDGESFGEFRPYAGGFRAEIEIDFANPAIGHQTYVLNLTPETFRRDICRARTFGRMSDVAKLWSAGYALGASMQNSVVFDDTCVMNAEGLRYADECVRHKVLDVVGDLALAGLPLIGLYRSMRGGHKLNHAVLTALLADRSAWRVVEPRQAAPVPQPVRRRSRVAEAGGMVGGMVAPAFSPDVS